MSPSTTMIRTNTSDSTPMSSNEPTITKQQRLESAFKWPNRSEGTATPVPGHSPFTYRGDPRNHILRIDSLDMVLTAEKPDGIDFDDSDLIGYPQTACYQIITLSGSMSRSLEKWPFFTIRQSLAEGEPAGYPGLNPLIPWEDRRMGWFRIVQGGKRLGVEERLVAGSVEIECCCVALLDNPSQGGFRGRYVFDFDCLAEEGSDSDMVVSLRAEVLIGEDAV